MRASKLLLLMLILGMGAGIEVAHGVRDELAIGPTGCRVLSGRFYGPSFSFDREARRELEPGTALLIENAFGAVTVSGTGEAGELSARLRTRVYAPKEEAAAFAERVQLVLEEEGGRLRVATNREALGARSRRTPGFETVIELRVPAGTAVEVRSHHAKIELTDVGSSSVTASYEPVSLLRVAGDVELNTRHGGSKVASVEGGLVVDASHGDLSVEQVAGAARIKLRHGALSARGVAGLRLQQRYGDLEASEIAGDLQVDAHHAGVRAREVSGSVRIETSFADVSLEEIVGDAHAVLRHGGLRVKTAGGRLQAELHDGSARLDAVTGPLALKTRRSDVRISGLREGGRVESDGNDVELRDFSGPLEVEARLGDVRLFPAAPLEHPLSAAIRDGGALVLEVDPGDGFRLESESRTGEVRVSLPGFEATTRERGRLVGRVGTGTTPVVLRAERGDVEVRASGSR